MRKFPLQLLILLVVGNSIDRSTESSGKPGSKEGKEQSEELGNAELGLWEPPGRRRGHTEVRRSRDRLEEPGAPGVPITSCTWGRTPRDGETAEIQPQQLKATFTRERLCYRFPLMSIKASWLNPALHKAN